MALLIPPGMAYNYGKLTKDVISEIFPPAAEPWLSMNMVGIGKFAFFSPRFAGCAMKTGSLLLFI